MRRAHLLALAVLIGACAGKKKDLPPGAHMADASLADAGAASADAPSSTDCELAIANMQKLAPALVPGDAEDLSECLKLPRALVVCLQTAATQDAADACVDRVAGAPVFGPDAGARADEATCKKLVAHFRTLVPEAERDETEEASMLAACTRQLTPEEAACALAARTRAEAQACLDGT